MLARDTVSDNLGPLWPCPLHHTQGWGGPSNLSWGKGANGVPQHANPLSQAAESNQLIVGRGGWGSSLADLATPPFFYSNKVKP
jgi:hypothetical protein